MLNQLQGVFSSSATSERKGQTMTQEFNVIIEKDEDGYYVASVRVARMPYPSEVVGCAHEADSEAIELCLEVETPVTNEFIGV